MVINPIVGVYIPSIGIPIKGGMTIPNIATFDHGTYLYIYIPGSQMTPGLIGKDLVLEGWSPKIEDKQVPGMYIYIYT